MVVYCSRWGGDTSRAGTADRFVRLVNAVTHIRCASCPGKLYFFFYNTNNVCATACVILRASPWVCVCVWLDKPTGKWTIKLFPHTNLVQALRFCCQKHTVELSKTTLLLNKSKMPQQLRSAAKTWHTNKIVDSAILNLSAYSFRWHSPWNKWCTFLHPWLRPVLITQQNNNNVAVEALLSFILKQQWENMCARSWSCCIHNLSDLLVTPLSHKLLLQLPLNSFLG